MTTNMDIQKRAMIEALEKSMGIVTTACKAVGIARSTHYNWYADDEAYRKATDETVNVALDFAETHLYRQIESDVPASTIFFLKTKGKGRGYVESSEQVIYTPDSAPSWLDGSSLIPEE